MTARADASPASVAPGPTVENKHALRAALGQFTTGVTIVTTLAPDGRRIGLTANSFSSVSLDPPLVLWSLSKRSANLEAYRSANHFAINVLSSAQHELCQRFARRNEQDRFSGVALMPSEHGLPLLEGTLASFECEMHAQHEAGDHIVFIGRVTHYRASEGDALIFLGGRMLSSRQAVELH